MPAGFKYRGGSGTLNGAAAEPAVASRQLTWSNLSFAANETKTFQLLLIVGSGVAYGQYVNEAWAINNLVNSRVSNTASVAVRLTPDPTFDCTDLVGKVFDDTNANGYQDEGERGLPNVRVVTARGWLATTDSQGRFHIVCAATPNEDRGENFVMKLDEKTLPTGYRMTTENPRAILLTAGKMARIDFGATLFQVVRLDLSSSAFQSPAAPAPARGPELAWEVIEESSSPACQPKIGWQVFVDLQAIAPLRFKVAKSAIEPEHLALIRDALDRVRAMPGVRNVRLSVVGHTDSSPITGRLKQTIADNWVLSRSRAAATAALLREKLQLPPESVVSDGKADTVPVATNDTPEGRALNRRVEVQVIYEQQVSDDSGCRPQAPPTCLPQTSWEVVTDSSAISPLRFKVAKSAIEPEHLAQIRDALDRVRAMPDVRNVRLSVVGHTDSSPIIGRLKQTIADNWVLSRSRAAATAALLREKLQLAPESVVSDGKADTVPVASNDTPEGRALNRRVEVQVLYERKVVHSGDCPAIAPERAATVYWVRSSFLKDPASAQALADALKSSGHRASANMFAVRVGPWKNRRQAQKERDKLSPEAVAAAGAAKPAKPASNGASVETGGLPWLHAMDQVMEQLSAKPSVLRLGYCRLPDETEKAARRTLAGVADEARRRWKVVPDRYALIIEQEIDGSACSGAKP
jgi:flagellar motor protein MotB